MTKLTNMKQSTGTKGIVFNEIYVDAMGGRRLDSVGDEEILAKAYDIMLSETKGDVAGYFFLTIFDRDPAIETVIRAHYLQ